jgi:hypothetical protein
MRLFSENDGFEAMRRGVRFTQAMLAASAEHRALARPLDALLVQWSTLDAAALAADDGMTDANAHVASHNNRLDAVTRRFAARLIADCGGDREHPTYRRFFPVSVSQIIRLALGRQLEPTRQLVMTAEHVTISRGCRALLDEMVTIEASAHTVLTARETALQEQSRVSQRIATFREEANKARRAIETALDDYANQHHLPRGYAQGFFLLRSAGRSRRKSTPPTAPSPATSATA